jgi:hypothetical protein
MDFIQPKLDGHASIGKVGFSQPKAAPALFNSGYLTIDQKRWEVSGPPEKPVEKAVYSLKLPNSEVEDSYNAVCFETVFGSESGEPGSLREDLLKAIDERDAEGLAKIFGGLLANVAHKLHRPEEAWYHSMIQIVFNAAKLEALGEAAGATGQADIALILAGGRRAVVEMKYRKAVKGATKAQIEKTLSRALSEALRAITEKDYAGPFRLSAGEVIGLGLAVYGRSKVKAGFVKA